MLTCQDFSAVVSDYLEGRLPMGLRFKAWFHLSMCSTCRRYLRQMRATVRLAGRLEIAPPPPEVREALMKAFRERKKP